MGSPLMVIAEVRRERAAERALAEHNHVVQALPPNRADHAFHIRPLPGRTRSGQHLLDPHGLDLLDEIMAEDSVTIPQQVTRSTIPRKRLPELVRSPFRGRMGCHAEVYNAPPVVCQDQEDVEDLETDRGHGKEVDGYQTVNVILQKSPPGLRGWFSMPHHILGDRGFGDLDPQLEQLAMNPRSTPAWVVPTHPPNQLPHLLWHAGPTGLAAAYPPRPEQAEALA